LCGDDRRAGVENHTLGPFPIRMDAYRRLIHCRLLSCGRPRQIKVRNPEQREQSRADVAQISCQRHFAAPCPPSLLGPIKRHIPTLSGPCEGL
jgi:hypothetical protein